MPNRHNGGFYFFNSFFFRKLVITLKEDATNGFKNIARWFKDINIFKCDYIFLPILLSGHWSMIVMCYLGSSTIKLCLLHLNSIKSTTHLNLQEHIKLMGKTNSLETLKISKKDLLELQMQVVEVPQQPKDNGSDCGIYLIKSVDIFLNTIVEGVFLEQNSENILKKVHWELEKVTFQDAEVNSKRISIKQTIMMLEGGSISAASDEDKNNNCTSESEGVQGVLSGILKIPSYPCSTRRKPKNPKRLNPHGKCLTSEEFTLTRLKAIKEEDSFNEKEEKK